MSASIKMVSLLFCVLVVIAPAAGAQTQSNGTAIATGQGAISAYDSSGRLMYSVDAAGNRSGAGASTATAATPLPAKPKAAIALAGLTIHVPADQPTIQAAIDAAVDGDTVLVADGIYNENINFKGKAITVTSVNGNKVTTIDGGKLNRVVVFVTNETAASVLNGFTITNGFIPDEGGGIAIENSAAPTITNNAITNNGACNGAGIGIGFAGPLIQGNTITNNFQAGCTGGIGGGGISIRGESSGTRLIGNVIANNLMTFSGINGGGLVLFAGGSPVIQSNVISNNNQFGIAMVNSSTPQLVQNLIIHNTGGGLTTSFGGGTGMTIINNTFADNDAQTSFVANFNAASAIGGSLPPDAIVQNNLLIAKPGQTAVFCTFTLPAGFLSNDVFSDGGTAFDVGCGTAPTGTNGNISSDPLFVDPSVDNFHLQPLSPAVDTGNNTTPNPLPATDLDGNTRIFNTTIDMGTFEYQGTTTATYSATSLAYAPQLVGTSSTVQAVTITNTGSTALQITPFVITGDFTQTNDCHTSAGIAAGKTCTINISFAPTASGTRTGQLTVTSNEAASPTTINLSGVGTGAVASLSVTNLSFTNQLVGSTSTAQSFTLTSTGQAPLTIKSIAASGDFAQTNNCGASVATSTFCTVNVTFTPTDRGIRNGAITITDNAADSPQSVSLQGTGIGPAATLGAASLTFASQLAGTTSAAQPVTLTSSGETALNIGSIAASGDFAQTNDCGASIPAGQSCTIQVSFTPTARGTRTGTVSIVDNSTSSPEHVNLSGTGIAPVASLSRTSLAFGNEVLNVAVSSAVTLTNTGDAALGITSIAAGGDFSQTNNCGSSLAVQAQCTINITFSATALGPQIDSLVFTDSALNSPQSVALSGTGVQLGLSSSTLVFGNQIAGTSSAAQVVTVTNPGVSALNITSIVPSAGFSQTNNCGTSLAGNASCTLNVAFGPNAAGPFNGLVTLNYNGTQSTITASGTGTDFSMAPQPGGSSTATVNAGGTATYNLALSGTTGFTGSVSLTCSGAPAAATCSINPVTANLNGTTPINFTVSVSTTSRASALPIAWNRLPGTPPVNLLLLALFSVAAVLLALANRRKLRYGVLAAAVLGMAMLMTACGGGGSTPPPPPPPHGTPAGTSTLVVTATSGTATRTSNLTLNVN
jgi:parallel beta-helix repeat protein